SRFFCNLRTSSHSGSHLGARKCRSVVYTVTGHSRGIFCLQERQNAILLLWHYARKYTGVSHGFFKLFIVHLVHLTTVEHLISLLNHTEFLTNTVSCLDMVSGYHTYGHASINSRCNGSL